MTTSVCSGCNWLMSKHWAYWCLRHTHRNSLCLLQSISIHGAREWSYGR